MASSMLVVSVVMGKWEAASPILGVGVGACEDGWGRWIAWAACRSLHWALGAAVLQAIKGPSLWENRC